MKHEDKTDIGAFVPGPPVKMLPTSAGGLSGRYFAAKDLIDVAGYVTGGGNPDWLRSHAPASCSAPVVERLLAAGATLLAKTVTDELAFSLEGVNAFYGTPLNSACPDRIPGGSSSGSASAVAARLVDFAVGTDTGGSVRVPASFCGLYGFRPTHGAVSLEGVIPFAPSYDTVGLFAREMATLSAVCDVMLPNLQHAPVSKLFLVRDAFELADHDVAAKLERVCASLGVEDELSLFDGDVSRCLECYRVLQGAEIWRELGPWIAAAKPSFGPAIAARFADAAAISKTDVARFLPYRAEFAARVRGALSEGVGFVLPTAPCIALRKNASEKEIANFYQRALPLTSVAGHAGLPQLTLPVAKVSDCPIGLSIVTNANWDRSLLEVASRWADCLDKEKFL